MFYCNPCATDLNYPESFMRSRGRCELCGSVESCNDVRSVNLPDGNPDGWSKVRARERENERIRKEAELKKASEKKEKASFTIMQDGEEFATIKFKGSKAALDNLKNKIKEWEND